MTYKEILEQTKDELDRLVSEAKRKLDDLVKPELEADKWYKGTVDFESLIYITEVENVGEYNDIHGYGFKRGDWNSLGHLLSNTDHEKSLVEATEQEVEDALVKEAERRGFLTRGTFFKSFTDKDKVREVQPFESYDGTFNPIELSFNGCSLYYKEGLKNSYDLCSNPRVFEDGKWAEVIKENQSTLDQDIKVLKEKYPNLKFTITVEENIQ